MITLTRGNFLSKSAGGTILGSTYYDKTIAQITGDADDSVLVNRAYVDSIAVGTLNPSLQHTICALASTTDVDLTTASTGTLIDGVAATAGMRVLLKNQTLYTSNGIYTAHTSTGIGGTGWVRATDMDGGAEADVDNWVPIQYGAVNANSTFIITMGCDGAATFIDTNEIYFVNMTAYSSRYLYKPGIAPGQQVFGGSTLGAVPAANAEFLSIWGAKGRYGRIHLMGAANGYDSGLITIGDGYNALTVGGKYPLRINGAACGIYQEQTGYAFSGASNVWKRDDTTAYIHRIEGHKCIQLDIATATTSVGIYADTGTFAGKQIYLRGGVNGTGENIHLWNNGDGATVNSITAIKIENCSRGLGVLSGHALNINQGIWMYSSAGDFSASTISCNMYSKFGVASQGYTADFINLNLTSGTAFDAATNYTIFNGINITHNASTGTCFKANTGTSSIATFISMQSSGTVCFRVSTGGVLSTMSSGATVAAVSGQYTTGSTADSNLKVVTVTNGLITSIV